MTSERINTTEKRDEGKTGIKCEKQKREKRKRQYQ